MIKPLARIRKIILDVWGAAGAFSWAFEAFFALASLTVLTIALSIYVLPAIALAVGIWAAIEYYRTTQGQPPLLPGPLKFLLKVLGAAGATYFTLTWIMLVAAALGASLAFPPLVLLLVPIGIGLVSAWVVYQQPDPNTRLGKLHAVCTKIHEVITQVLGAGGATFWLLGFLAVTLSLAAVVFPPLVFVIIPIVFVGLAAVWYAKVPAESPPLTEAIQKIEPPLSEGGKEKDKKESQIRAGEHMDPQAAVDVNTSSTDSSCLDGLRNYFASCSSPFSSSNSLSVPASSASKLTLVD